MPACAAPHRRRTSSESSSAWTMSAQAKASSASTYRSPVRRHQRRRPGPAGGTSCSALTGKRRSRSAESSNQFAREREVARPRSGRGAAPRAAAPRASPGSRGRAGCARAGPRSREVTRRPLGGSSRASASAVRRQLNRRARSSPRAASDVAEPCVRQEPANRFGDRRLVGRIEEQRRVAGDLRQRRPIGAGDRDPARHRLEHGQTEALDQRRKDEARRRRVERRRAPRRRPRRESWTWSVTPSPSASARSSSSCSVGARGGRARVARPAAREARG